MKYSLTSFILNYLLSQTPWDTLFLFIGIYNIYNIYYQADW